MNKKHKISAKKTIFFLRKSIKNKKNVGFIESLFYKTVEICRDEVNFEFMCRFNTEKLWYTICKCVAFLDNKCYYIITI